MANHVAAALLIVASLLVAVTFTDARIAVQLDTINGGNYAAKDAKPVPVPALVCSKVRAVQAEETCVSIEGRAGLTNEQFLSFNPNISCAGIFVGIFVGQWVCLDAVAAA